MSKKRRQFSYLWTHNQKTPGDRVNDLRRVQNIYKKVKQSNHFLPNKEVARLNKNNYSGTSRESQHSLEKYTTFYSSSVVTSFKVL